MDALRPVIGRLLASLVAALCGWLAHKFNFVVDPDTQTATATAIEGFVMLAVYGLAHKFFNLKFNPMDTASITLSKPESARAVKANVAERVVKDASLEANIPHGPRPWMSEEQLREYYAKGGGVAGPGAPHIPEDGV